VPELNTASATHFSKLTRRTVPVGLILVMLLIPGASRTEPNAEGVGGKNRIAEELYNRGYMVSLLGHFEQAILLFKKSLEIHPTAEAYTYMGWTYSHMGDFQRAITEAEEAIRIDPDFGNPYNDIGVYLMELGRDDEAVPYLKKAMRAKRYCCYQFPHFNMGRIYLNKKNYEEAKQEFDKSLAIDPKYLPAKDALELLEKAGIKGI